MVIPGQFWPKPWSKMISAPLNIQGRISIFSDDVRKYHSVIVGHPGSGKTILAENIAIMDVIRQQIGMSNRGWLLIDPAGDVSDNLIDRIALLALKHFPDLYKKVVIIDPTIREDWTVKIDLTALGDGEIAERFAKTFAEQVSTIFNDDPNITVRLYRIIYYTTLALILSGYPITDALEFLVNREFREDIVGDTNHADLMRFWFQEFPSAKREFQAMDKIESTMNRLSRILEDPAIKRIFDGGSTFRPRQEMDSGTFVIVPIPQGTLSQDTSRLMAGIFLALYEAAGLSRADIKERDRVPCTLFCDEFYEYLTPTIPRIIKLQRKYKLEFVGLTQEIANPLTKNELMGTVLDSVQNVFALRLSYRDASALVRDIFLPQIDQVKHTDRHYSSSFPWYQETYQWRGLDEIFEREKQAIISLSPGELYWRSRSENKTRKVHVNSLTDPEDLKDAHLIPEARRRLLYAVRRQYGWPPIDRHSSVD